MIEVELLFAVFSVRAPLPFAALDYIPTREVKNSRLLSGFVGQTVSQIPGIDREPGIDGSGGPL